MCIASPRRGAVVKKPEVDEELLTLNQDIARAITHCLEIGFVSQLSTGGMECDVLAERNTPDQMMILPINIMISDSRGEAARVFIGADRKPRLVAVDGQVLGQPPQGSQPDG